jgi:hypothetical protein
MADGHIIEQGHAPTPFTADEIRRASRRGHTTRVLMERAGEEPVVRVTEFVAVNPEAAEMRFRVETPNGTDGDGITVTAAWTELQAHASYPQDAVAIEDDDVDLGWGHLSCHRYTVVDGDTTATHWFSKAHPGMPVLTEVRVGSDLVARTTVLSIEER